MGFNIISAAEAASYIKHGYNMENPGCFDDPGKTFLDPYMKSGLYITEIVKRLYRCLLYTSRCV